MPRRSTVSTLLMVIGGLALAAGVLAAYARDVIADDREFADRAVTAFEQPEVRAAMADGIVDHMVTSAPDLLRVRPLMVTVVDGVLRTDIASDAFEFAVSDLHRTVVQDENDAVVVRMTDLLLIVKTNVAALSPELAEKIPDDLTDAIVSVRTGSRSVDLVRLSGALGLLALALPLIAIACFVAMFMLAHDVRSSLLRLGLVMISAATLVLVTSRIARRIIVDSPVGRAVWDAFMDPLDRWVLTFAGAGAVIAALAWFGVGEARFADRVDRFAHLVRRRSNPHDRVGWSLAVGTSGLLLLAEPQAISKLVVMVLGAGLLTVAVREAVSVLAPSLVEGARSRERGEAADSNVDSDRDSKHQNTGRWMATAVLVALGGLTVILISRSDGDDADRVSLDAACNGSILLCDRRLDEVTLAASHNSHAAVENDFLNGYQGDGIVTQLENGIRGFLIDIYFGVSGDDDLIVTDRAPADDAERTVLVAELGEPAVRAAEEVRASASRSGGTRSLYLCHAVCEIGATPLVDELARIRTFLTDHPREVIVLIIQDEGPTPTDIADAFAESGLDELVITLEPDRPLPTLGEMIDADTRVLVTSENRSAGVDWNHDAFTWVQDTPFIFDSIQSFNCDLYRGQADSPMLLVNHWLSPVSPTAADRANRSDVLAERVDQCREERGMAPNLIAVDYAERGDLVSFVDELNGLPSR